MSATTPPTGAGARACAGARRCDEAGRGRVRRGRPPSAPSVAPARRRHTTERPRSHTQRGSSAASGRAAALGSGAWPGATRSGRPTWVR
eukprot:scaffold292225_cov26-Tisochrysis_lutea.AAC.2